MNGKTYVSTALDKKRLNAVFRPNGAFRADGLDVIWLETDPRRFSTTGDGLPDGWKKQYGLDPFDDGVIGDYNLHTGKIITNTNNGPNGDPDGDGVTNLQEYLNGTDPTVSQHGRAASRRIDHHRPRASQRAGDGRRRHERQGVHRLDRRVISSRSRTTMARARTTAARTFIMPMTVMIRRATSWRSTRTTAARCPRAATATSTSAWTCNDLLAYAEQGYLDIYVAINVGKPGTGERLLPDDIDTLTNMGWQAVVACYQTNQGTVYVDTNPCTTPPASART